MLVAVALDGSPVGGAVLEAGAAGALETVVAATPAAVSAAHAASPLPCPELHEPSAIATLVEAPPRATANVSATAKLRPMRRRDAQASGAHTLRTGVPQEPTDAPPIRWQRGSHYSRQYASERRHDRARLGAAIRPFGGALIRSTAVQRRPHRRRCCSFAMATGISSLGAAPAESRRAVNAAAAKGVKCGAAPLVGAT